MFQVLERLRSLFGEDLVLSLLEKSATKEQISSFQCDGCSCSFVVVVVVVVIVVVIDVIIIVTAAAVPVVVTRECDCELWVGKDLEGGSSVSINRYSLSCTTSSYATSDLRNFKRVKKIEIATFLNWASNVSLQE
jgi:hypothetical protein